MSRKVPMAPCLALLKQFDPDNPTPQQAIATAAEAVERILGDAMTDVNDGQFAALIDSLLWNGQAWFVQSKIVEWIQGGNFTLPPSEFAAMGPRGLAELQVWCVGNSL